VGERFTRDKERRTRQLRAPEDRKTKGLRLPDFIAVGPPRTGTTWLDRVLRDHVALPGEVKETQFFLWNYHLGVDWYRQFFRNCDTELVMGEIAPTYFDQSVARERIAEVIPDCKIVCTLRDPVARAYSHYKTWHRAGLISGPFDFQKQYRRLGANGSYADNVSAWRKYFGAENVLILLYDDLVTDRASYLENLCDFIDIAPIDLQDTRWDREKAAEALELPRNLTLARLGGRLRTYLTRRQSLRLAHHFESGKPLWRLLFAGGPRYPRLDPETEASLRQRFIPEIEELERLLGRDLTAWKAIEERQEHPLASS
jgi:hypothetical protein